MVLCNRQYPYLSVPIMPREASCSEVIALLGAMDRHLRVHGRAVPAVTKKRHGQYFRPRKRRG
eukprot:scaffold196328_cov20-Prasinocladus_malaysianus.AAC.1